MWLLLSVADVVVDAVVAVVVAVAVVVVAAPVAVAFVFGVAIAAAAAVAAAAVLGCDVDVYARRPTGFFYRFLPQILHSKCRSHRCGRCFVHHAEALLEYQ